MVARSGIRGSVDNGERIFNSKQLLRATETGTVGKTVVIEVNRDGELLTLNAVRGPMGVAVYEDSTDYPLDVCDQCGDYL